MTKTHKKIINHKNNQENPHACRKEANSMQLLLTRHLNSNHKVFFIRKTYFVWHQIPFRHIVVSCLDLLP